MTESIHEYLKHSSFATRYSGQGVSVGELINGVTLLGHQFCINANLYGVFQCKCGVVLAARVADVRRNSHSWCGVCMSDLSTIPSGDTSIRFEPIAGFHGYAVGNDGSVWSCRHKNKGNSNRWERLKASPTRSGYPRVSMVKAGKKHDAHVHALVLEAFVGPCPEGMLCRHFPDNTKTNCRLENLSWGTPKENSDDMDIHGTRPRGELVGTSVLKESTVREILQRSDSGERVVDISRNTGVPHNQVSRIIHRKRWGHVRVA